MLIDVNPKLPMRNKSLTKCFYIEKLGFHDIGIADFEGYLMLAKDDIQIHFFEFKDLIAEKNYGQVYIRTNAIYELYQKFIKNKVQIHPNGTLEIKPWRQMEFSILDPDYNLITFGQSI